MGRNTSRTTCRTRNASRTTCRTRNRSRTRTTTCRTRNTSRSTTRTRARRRIPTTSEKKFSDQESESIASNEKKKPKDDLGPDLLQQPKLQGEKGENAKTYVNAFNKSRDLWS